MTEEKGNLVVRVYAVNDDREVLIRETSDGQCVSAVMNWIVSHPPESNGQTSQNKD